MSKKTFVVGAKPGQNLVIEEDGVRVEIVVSAEPTLHEITEDFEPIEVESIENGIRYPIVVAGQTVMVETHVGPDNDEVTAQWLIEREGTAEFLAKHAPDGVLRLGVGGGDLDEHPKESNGHVRTKVNCTTTLTARELRIAVDSKLAPILTYALKRDTTATSEPFDFAGTIKLLHKLYPNDPLKVIAWGKRGLDAKLAEEKLAKTFSVQHIGVLMCMQSPDKPQMVANWLLEGARAKALEQTTFLEARADFRNPDKTTCMDFELHERPRPIRIVTIKSDNPEMSKFARSKDGGLSDVVILNKASGQVQIFTSEKAKLDMAEVARILDYEEQKALGMTPTLMGPEGTGLSKRWHFMRNGQMILNGSNTHPDVPATMLSLEQVVSLVKIGLHPQMFDEQRAELYCQRGRCHPTCPWRGWDLPRCNKVRSTPAA
ncbi:hypothetical protein HQ571_04945 [Candidatus Kuenenbacteria bacterium]|nr:hypothetical protein [Candidatus Kuenenbacteria bacterium]